MGGKRVYTVLEGVMSSCQSLICWTGVFRLHGCMFFLIREINFYQKNMSDSSALLERAKALLRQHRYEEARQLLANICHPGRSLGRAGNKRAYQLASRHMAKSAALFAQTGLEDMRWRAEFHQAMVAEEAGRLEAANSPERSALRSINCG